jgi:hypothetical protein
VSVPVVPGKCWGNTAKEAGKCTGKHRSPCVARRRETRGERRERSLHEQPRGGAGGQPHTGVDCGASQVGLGRRLSAGSLERAGAAREPSGVGVVAAHWRQRHNPATHHDAPQHPPTFSWQSKPPSTVHGLLQATSQVHGGRNLLYFRCSSQIHIQQQEGVKSFLYKTSLHVA